jgi:hypothetical protein
MKNLIKVFGIIALAAVIGFSMAACGDVDGGGGLPAPTGLKATVNSTTLTISWNAVAGAAGYNLYIGSSSTKYEDPVDMEGETATSVPLSDLPSGTYTLYFKVAAYSKNGTEGAMSNFVSVTITDNNGSGGGGTGNLPAPTGLTAIAYSSSGIALNWTAVPGATSYKIYNGFTSSPSNLLGSVDSNSAFNISLQANTTVYYKVSAVNASGEGAMSSVVSATTLGAGTFSLNGVWSCDEYGGMQITVRNNTTGYYTRLMNLIPSYTSAVSKGLIILNDQRWRNITSTGNLTFSAQEQLVVGNNDVAQSTQWNSVYFTLSADGQTLTMYNSQNQTGTSIVWTRESNISGDGFTSIAAMSAWLALQPGNTPYSAYTVRLSVPSLGGTSAASGSAGKALRDNPTKYVILDLTGSTFTTIENSAFGSSVDSYMCKSLVGVYIPNTVTSIGTSAFRGSSLASIEIPYSITSIGADAFHDCKSLASAIIGNGVTNIGANAFQACTSLASVTIGSGVTTIGNNAFNGCTALTDVTIPDRVTSIGSSAFGGCTGLTSVTVPNNVTSIGSSAFSGCNGLTSVIIGSGVNDIGSSAFANCNSLTSVTFLKAGLTFNTITFYNQGNLLTVYTSGGVGTYTRSGSTWTKS